MKRILKTAGIQLAPCSTKEESLKKAGGLVRLAAKKGVRLICLPQLFTTPWFPHKIDIQAKSFAETEDGPTLCALKELAAEENVVLVAPIFEREGSEHFSTAFIIGQSGEIIGKYRKVHVPQIPLWEERAYFRPGNLGFPVFETPYCRIGVQICWDVFFPEGFRILALKGAEVVFAPTASAFYHSRTKWERAIQAAAHGNGLFIFRVNRVGKEKRQDFYGRSFCAGPDGEFVVKPAGSSEGIIIAELDMGELSAARNEWVFLKDRRPENYGEIARKIVNLEGEEV
jgi:N-carbamoylputrescine amidase